MIQRSVILGFPPSRVDKPVISSVIRRFDVEVNILQAHVTPEEAGRMFTIFRGSRAQVSKALDYLRENEVQTILPARNLVWDEALCVHCGACVGQCLSSAFSVDSATRRIVYDGDRCIACELCIPACAYGAIEPIGAHLEKLGELL